MIAVWRRATEFDRAMLINAGLLFPHAFGKREEWFAALAMCPLFGGAVWANGGWVLTIPEGPFRAISVGEGGIYEVCVEEPGETPEERKARVAAWIASLPWAHVPCWPISLRRRVRLILPKCSARAACGCRRSGVGRSRVVRVRWRGVTPKPSGFGAPLATARGRGAFLLGGLRRTRGRAAGSRSS